MDESIISAIIGGGWILGGLFTFYRFFTFYKKAKSSLDWPSTKGVILKSYFDNTDDTIDYHIEYKYIIKETEYIGNKLFFRTFDGDNTNYKKKYPVNKEVNIYYNPKKPSECVLITGIDSNLYSLIAIGLFLSIVGTLTLIYARP